MEGKNLKPYYQHAGITIYHGDCREILPSLETIDTVLTDPLSLATEGQSGKEKQVSEL